MCTKCEWHKEWVQRVTHPWLAVMNDSPHRMLLQPQLWLTQPTNKDDTWQLTMLVKIPAIPLEDKKLGVCLLLPSPHLSAGPLSHSFYFSILFLFSLSWRTTWGAQALFFKLGLWLVQLLGVCLKALAVFFNFFFFTAPWLTAVTVMWLLEPLGMEMESVVQPSHTQAMEHLSPGMSTHGQTINSE